jgi:outer membrane murein-binding lipoprotein Lpp
MIRSLAGSAAVVVAAAMLAGCSSTPERGAVSATAQRFVRAVEAKQGAAACDRLTGSARQAVSGATKTPCARAVLNVDERGDRVRRVQVWGDAAQVVIGSDTLFLHRQRAGWAVRAAGCRRQANGVYNCEVDG